MLYHASSSGAGRLTSPTIAFAYIDGQPIPFFHDHHTLKSYIAVLGYVSKTLPFFAHEGAFSFAECARHQTA